MLVSVVVACYNHEVYLRTCLDSLSRQNYSRIELIVIDDASSDGSYDLLKSITRDPRFSRRFEKVHIDRNPTNLGAAATWNRAISGAAGTLIFLLNSDDYFEPNRISTFVADWNGNPCYFAFSAIAPVDSSGQPVTNSISADMIYKPHRLLAGLPSVSWALLDYNITVTTGNFVFTPTLFSTVGGFADLRYCHDWHFALRAATIVEPTLLLETRYLYRLHANNSFLSLAGLAGAETRQCYQAYASMALLRRPANRRCLSTFNQGASFWKLAELVSPFNEWLKREYLPYRPYHRTVTEHVHSRSRARP